MFWKRKKRGDVKYTLFVDDNYHFTHEDNTAAERGEYATYEEAVGEAKRIIDHYLEEAYEPPMTAEELLESYKLYGEDPFVVPDRGKKKFSGWDYAAVRCREICGRGKGDSGA